MPTWNTGMDIHILIDSEQRDWLLFQMAFMFSHLFMVHTEDILIHAFVCFISPPSSLSLTVGLF